MTIIEEGFRMLFIVNGESESCKEDQCRIVGVMKDGKIKVKDSTRLTYTGI